MGLISGISYALGARRTFVRRLAGIALLWMGVHAAADVLDDVLYRMLDGLDLVVDESVAALLSGLSSLGGITPDTALAGIERFASLVDLAEKDWLALRLAFVAELLLDLLLLDLAWGKRTLEGATVGEDFRESLRQLRQALRAFDLERVLGPVTLLAFTMGGSVLAAVAIEQPVRRALQASLPELLFGTNVAAMVGLLAIALLVWRFVPDVLHGALVRSHARAEMSATKLAQVRATSTPRFPKLQAFRDRLRRASRGLWLLLALFVAVAGLLGGTQVDDAQGLPALIARCGAFPEAI